MTMMNVQCKGSGQAPRNMTTNKKAQCPYCQKAVEVAPSNGRLRKHTIRTTKAKLRAGKR